MGTRSRLRKTLTHARGVERATVLQCLLTREGLTELFSASWLRITRMRAMSSTGRESTIAIGKGVDSLVKGKIVVMVVVRWKLGSDVRAIRLWLI